MNELLPCPFCGGEATMQSELEVYAVMCRDCGAHGETFADWYVDDVDA